MNDNIKTLKKNREELKKIINKNINKTVFIIHCIIALIIFLFLISNIFILNEKFINTLSLILSLPLLNCYLMCAHLITIGGQRDKFILNKEQLEIFYPILKEVLGDKEIAVLLNKEGKHINIKNRTGNAYLLLKLHEVAINRVNENLENENIEKQLNSL